MQNILSIVIPIFNEEENIPILYKELNKSLTKTKYRREIIFVNDGSQDSSLQKIKKLISKDKNIKVISFSRNFGHMAAIDAGLKHASGQKIVLMDADMQDPPSVIPLLLKKSMEGFDVVYGIKEKRKEGLVRRIMFNSFYHILNSLVIHKMPLNAGTFSVLDRKIVDILVSLPEKNKYVSGLRAWVGFTQTGVIYERGKRTYGREASIARLIKLALDGIFSFSYVPLRIASTLGIFFSLFSFIFIFIVILLRLFTPIGIVGWASTLSVILFVGGIQLLTLGIIGEYIARMYDEVKGRPTYIVAEKIGFKVSRLRKK